MLKVISVIIAIAILLRLMLDTPTTHKTMPKSNAGYKDLRRQLESIGIVDKEADSDER